MGAIMAVGVASANSILLVTFARQQLAGKTARPGDRRRHGFVRADDGGCDDRRRDSDGNGGAGEAECRSGACRHRRPVRDSTTLLVVPYLFAMLRKGTTANLSMVYSKGYRMSNIEPLIVSACL